MIRKLICASTLVLVSLSPALAIDMDIQDIGQLKADSEPIQILPSQDGMTIYILTKNGTIEYYGNRGMQKGTVDVGKDVTSMALLSDNNLMLTTANSTDIRVVSISPVVKIEVGDSPIKGDTEAPVSIVVFDDFECPYCAKAEPLFKQVFDAYDPAEVNFVFKNFPLSFHKSARIAAIAGLAAKKQGKFWPMHDALFDNYNRLSLERIQELAKIIGLDLEQFNKDMNDPSLQAAIEADIKLGQEVGVSGTPSVFINGKPLRQRSLQGFKAVIDPLLKK